MAKIETSTVIITLLLVIAQIGFAYVRSSAAAAQLDITIDSSMVIGENALSVGYQLDAVALYAWQSRSTLRDYTRDAGFKLVRVWNNAIEPCSRWYESTKTGTWRWSEVDSLVKGIIGAGGEPLIVLGFYSWGRNRLMTPEGMATNATTGLPYPSSWGAYCAEWAKHFKAVGLGVRYYEIINEIFQYWKHDGWPAPQPKLGYFMDLFNSAAKAMRAASANVRLGNDASMMKGVLDYFISKGEKLDFLSFHAYGTGSTSTSDSEAFNGAETVGIFETSSNYGVDKARQLYKSKKGLDLPVIESEYNLDWTFSSGTDPRIQKMQGALYNALNLRTCMLKGIAYNIYFHFSSSASQERRKSTGGYGFGMTNLDNNNRWYPYYVSKMFGANLAVGDKIFMSNSTSSDVRVVSWNHGGKLNIVLICKVTEARSVRLQGVTGQLNYTKIDNTISWTTPKVQTGSIEATNLITLNGYTVMLLQKNLEPTDSNPSCDVNQDGVLNIIDLIFVSNAVGSQPGSLNWDPQADVNKDNKVNLYDLIVLQNQFRART